MKRIKELHGGGLYILEARNAANTHLVENEKEVDQFLIFANSHFRQFMDICDYCITPTGWLLLIRIKNSTKVIKTYISIQQSRNKQVRLSQVGQIISNQVRLFRLRMTRWTNKQRGRKGNASMQVYRRYTLDSLEEGIEYIDRLRNHRIDLDQPLQKYQAPIENYEISDNVVYEKMSSGSHRSQHGKNKLYLKCLKIGDYVSLYLDNWIRRTRKIHQMAYRTSKVLKI